MKQSCDISWNQLLLWCSTDAISWGLLFPLLQPQAIEIDYTILKRIIINGQMVEFKATHSTIIPILNS